MNHEEWIIPVIKFKTSVIRSNLWDYSDAYILVSGTIAIAGAGADDDTKRADERNEGVIFKNCAPFTDFIKEANNTQIDNAKDIDVVMPMYNLIKRSDNGSVYGSSKEMSQLIQYKILNHANSKLNLKIMLFILQQEQQNLQ